MTSITIQVDLETAQAFELASPEQQQKIQGIVLSRLFSASIPGI
jgi:hypothetical protein